MGQLEKYGLYVLCLVIFLILGVAIWGEPTPVHAGGSTAATAMLQVPEPGRKDAGAPKELVANDELIDQMFKKGPAGKDGKDSKDKGKAGDAKEPPKPEIGGKAAVDPPTPGDARRSTYKVKEGDVLSTIAMKQLGSMRHVDAILKLNPKVDPRHIKAGDELLLPSKAELAPAGGKVATKPEAAPKPADKAAAGTRTYTVADGDTYEGIAQKLFKSKARVADIEKLNPGIDPKKLRPGKPITVPVE